MGVVYACCAAVLGMTFVFVTLLLLHGLRKVIGFTGFYFALGLLFAVMQFAGVADMCIYTSFPGLNFDLANTVLLLPFLTALIVVYIADGTLEAQRLIIALLAGLGIYAYLVSMTFAQGSWSAGTEAFFSSASYITQMFQRSIRSMSANVVSFAIDLFLIPIIYQRLRNYGCRLFFCVTGALFVGQALDIFLYSATVFWGQQDWWREISSSYLSRAGSILLLSWITSIYLSRIHLEQPGAGRRSLDIIIAFFGASGKAERLERDLRESEERYSLLFRSAADLIVTANRSGRIIDANPAALRIMGIERADLKNTMLADVIDIQPVLWEQITDEDASSNGPLLCNTVMLKTERETELTLNAVNIGDTPMITIFGRDITERRKLDRERQEWQEQTFHWQRLESIGRLAGGIAHDFNNFLHAMQGHLDIIRYMHPVDDPDVNRHLDGIDAISEKAAVLTKQLLGFARKGNYHESEIVVKDFLRSALDMFLPASSAVPLHVDMKILHSEKQSYVIKGDPIQLQQALMNILFNARDAMQNEPEANRKLFVTVCTSADLATEEIHPPHEVTDWQEKNYCVIRVRDTGSGIPDDVKVRIFEPFFTTKPIGKGTGMGLSMAFGILRSHHGWIQADNAAEGGAEFTFFIPFLTAGDDAQPDNEGNTRLTGE